MVLLKGNNNLIGQIPSEVGSMTELNTFNLNDNLLSGEIPTEIGLLTVLWELDFSTYLIHINLQLNSQKNESTSQVVFA